MRRLPLLAMAAGLTLSATLAHAHRAWMLPSSTILAGKEPWVTVDAAVSTDLFHADHNPMRLEGLSVVAPDGSRTAAENASTGKYRSTFDVKLAQPGTYRLAVVSESMLASYRLNGETRRWRGAADAMAKDIPAGAQDLRVTRMQSRTETFITSGKPSDKALAPSGSGLELVPLTHPNDLVTGSPASFAFVLDGLPAAGVEVTVIPGGVRYRDKLGEMKFTTDAQGRINVNWPAAGMYWISATHGAAGMGDANAGGTLDKPARRASYSATVEVLPQ
ncbi:DUF4198 domain-containing protein [Piscinibacter terrae]|uniref:DUF4198 domain-containing protein n=1 Tax=Piscinibacter terrae TaxID=2496871 RepID=A0A3N7HUR3_9BURK|nr:DUF4198 domain-containing protein [Albitalea terrae]RQP26088.1 DUF4198 domain-containing protein [Albitalea terrae]